MARSLAGTRIRQRRRSLGVTQSALAAASGISPSYLNLIEHNRRGVAGRVLLGLARALEIAPGELADGAEDALLGELREIVALRPELKPEADSIEDMVGRFPGWSRTLASLQRQSRDQEAVITALSDRLTHDPYLRESLHLMLSTITAIYSTANILDTVVDIPPEQTRRFHANVHAESRRLSDAASRLVDYFDHAADRAGSAVTPEEDLDRFLADNHYRFAAIDEAAEDVTADRRAIEDAVRGVLADLGAPDHRRSASARAFLEQYAEDATKMPLTAFAEEARAHRYEPAALARRFGADLHAVFRRLATLRRPEIEAPAMGLVIVNAAGQALFRRPLPEFSLPRHGATCPLWPVFQCLSAPNMAVTRTIELPGGRRFAALSVALSENSGQFGAPPLVRSAMLVVALDELHDLPWLAALPTAAAQPIGLSCRICPRLDCAARSEPSILPPREAP